MDDFNNPYRPPAFREPGRSLDELEDRSFSAYVLRGAMWGAILPVLGIIGFAVWKVLDARQQGVELEFTNWEMGLAGLVLIYGVGMGAVMGGNRFKQLERRDMKLLDRERKRP
jgi:hypothetical protein